jgi:hypothetical protein
MLPCTTRSHRGRTGRCPGEATAHTYASFPGTTDADCASDEPQAALAESPFWMTGELVQAEGDRADQADLLLLSCRTSQQALPGPLIE